VRPQSSLMLFDELAEPFVVGARAGRGLAELSDHSAQSLSVDVPEAEVWKRESGRSGAMSFGPARRLYK
jgi:hypothetical protein